MIENTNVGGQSSINESTINEKIITSQLPTLHCGNLPVNFSSHDVKELFAGYNVETVSVRKTVNCQYAYAFVTFRDRESMLKALTEHKYHRILNKDVIVTEYSHNFTKYDEGNIFVRGFNDDVTASELDQEFSRFGNVVSVKIAKTAAGVSKRYAFIKFRNIKVVEDLLNSETVVSIRNTPLTLKPYNSKFFEQKEEKKNLFTNCFIKNFPPGYKKEDLVKLLGQFGEIQSIYFPVDVSGISAGYACVDFRENKSAQEAIATLHNKLLFTNDEMQKPDVLGLDPFYIQKFEKKRNRTRSISSNTAEFGDQEHMAKFGPRKKRNLYVRNIPETFSPEDIFDIFTKYGRVTDIYIAKDGMRSFKLYCYICYSTEEEAMQAVEQANQITLNGETLEVTFYMSHDDRKAVELEKKKWNNMNDVLENKIVSGLSTDQKSSQTSVSRSLSSFSDIEEINTIYQLALKAAARYREHWKLFGVSSDSDFAYFIIDKVSRFSENAIKTIVDNPSSLLSFIDLLIEELCNSQGNSIN